MAPILVGVRKLEKMKVPWPWAEAARHIDKAIIGTVFFISIGKGEELKCAHA
jgi:hypothetical protein